MNRDDQLVQWFGAEKLRRDIACVRRFWAGEGRFAISLTTPKHRPPQTTPDEERFHIYLASLEEQSRLPGLNVPSVFCDFGTVSIPCYWGGTVRVPAETGNPYLEPAASTMDEALALQPRPVDDPAMDAARALRLFHRLREALQTDQLWLRTPDAQGPLNTAAMIVNQDELLVAMHSEPEKVHQLLDRITSFQIEFWRYLHRESGGNVCGNIWPYTFVPSDRGVMFTEDMMPLLSAETYREFGIPVLRRIAKEFGLLHIHCCGRWGHHVTNLKAARVPIASIEFHWPCTTPEQIEPLAEATVFVPYLAADQQTRFRSNVELYRHLLTSADKRFRFWFACCEDTPETVAFVREFYKER